MHADANERANQILEAKCTSPLARTEMKVEGERCCRDVC